MRELRRIVFINSANIRHAEVQLDGNVHFNGTQGVGKSTLLRAILFFYTGNKLRLGIPREMRSFDEFYLPGPESCIVYEVAHEAGPFCVLTFRTSGRACFRFVEAPYSKDWLVNESGQVVTEYADIKKRLNGAFVSRIVDNYESYQKILYGAKHDLGKEFERFQLLRSSHFKSIPRSIQNVFLNSRLEADFIKEIIIRSMDEQEAKLDLRTYYGKLSAFEQECKDIACWDKKDRKGESIVRKQADEVVNAYHELLYMKSQIDDLCGELRYAVRVAGERLPALEEQLLKLSEELNRQKRLLSEIKDKYKKEQDSLNQEMGGVNLLLKTLKEKREYYDGLGIESVIQRCSKEEALKADLEGWREKDANLTATFNDIKTKYKALYQNCKNQLESFRQAQQKRVLEAGAERQQRDELLLQTLKEEQNKIRESFAERIETANGRVESVKAEQVANDKELIELKHLTPYEEERKALDEQLHQLELKRKELEGKVRALRSEEQQLRAELEMKSAESKATYQRKLDAKQEAINLLLGKIADLDRLLDRTKGSLFEWLEEHKPDWEQQIGKVIDEEAVLYRTGLHPELAEGDSLFGVKLNLIDLPVNVRKPKQLKAEKAELEVALQARKLELKTLQEEEVAAKEALEKGYTPKIKSVREQRAVTEVEIESLPGQVKRIQLQISDYEEKARAEIELRNGQLKARQSELAHDLSEAQAALNRVKADEKRQLAAADKRFNDQKSENMKLHAERVAAIHAETKSREQSTEVELSHLEKQKLDELAGRGANTALLEECQAKIRETERELSFIEQNRDVVILYYRDKKELFDQEEAIKTRKRNLTEKLQQLDEKYRLRRTKHDQLIEKLEGEKRAGEAEQAGIKEALRKADRFTHDGNLCPTQYVDVPERKTQRSPGEAVDELTSVIVARQGRQNEFKQSVNLFKSNFSAGNMFHFETNLNTDEDYIHLADMLDMFLVHNQLDEFRNRTNRLYLDILGRISKELSYLTRHESDVKKVIADINDDFRERNFVGVIKEISLRAVPSTERLVQLLLQLSAFYAENQFNVGELNLFSNENSTDTNQKAKGYLQDLVRLMNEDPTLQFVSLSDLFELQFRIKENDNDTGWTAKLSHVGSEGTDTLVKAMINIMLINVFKEKVSRKTGDFRIHCMMDEIGKLHPQNVKGILDFANARNIYLINSSPVTYNVKNYRYTYLLEKDKQSRTVIHRLIRQR